MCFLRSDVCASLSSVVRCLRSPLCSPHTLEPEPFSDVGFVTVFPTLLVASSDAQVFILIKPVNLFLLLLPVILVSCPRNHFQIQCHQAPPLCSSLGFSSCASVSDVLANFRKCCMVRARPLLCAAGHLSSQRHSPCGLPSALCPPAGPGGLSALASAGTCFGLSILPHGPVRLFRAETTRWGRWQLCDKF